MKLFKKIVVCAISIILVMLSIANPYGFLLFAAFFSLGFSLLFAFNIPHIKREMKNGRTFKQICKEDIFVFNVETHEMHHPNQFGKLSHVSNSTRSTGNICASNWNSDITLSSIAGNIYYNNYK